MPINFSSSESDSESDALLEQDVRESSHPIRSLIERIVEPISDKKLKRDLISRADQLIPAFITPVVDPDVNYEGIKNHRRYNSMIGLKGSVSNFKNVNFGASFEFYGDRVIELVAREYVYNRFPNIVSMAWLNVILEKFKSKRGLSQFAHQMGFEEYIQSHISLIDPTTSEAKSTILEDVFEGVTGIISKMIGNNSAKKTDISLMVASGKSIEASYEMLSSIYDTKIIDLDWRMLEPAGSQLKEFIDILVDNESLIGHKLVESETYPSKGETMRKCLFRLNTLAKKKGKTFVNTNAVNYPRNASEETMVNMFNDANKNSRIKFQVGMITTVVRVRFSPSAEALEKSRYNRDFYQNWSYGIGDWHDSILIAKRNAVNHLRQSGFRQPKETPAYTPKIELYRDEETNEKMEYEDLMIPEPPSDFRDMIEQILSIAMVQDELVESIMLDKNIRFLYKAMIFPSYNSMYNHLKYKFVGDGVVSMTIINYFDRRKQEYCAEGHLTNIRQNLPGVIYGPIVECFDMEPHILIQKDLNRKKSWRKHVVDSLIGALYILCVRDFGRRNAYIIVHNAMSEILEMIFDAVDIESAINIKLKPPYTIITDIMKKVRSRVGDVIKDRHLGGIDYEVTGYDLLTGELRFTEIGAKGDTKAKVAMLMYDDLLERGVVEKGGSLVPRYKSRIQNRWG